MFSNTLLGQKAPAALADVRSQLEEEFTRSLQRFAQGAGWPADVSSSLSVKHGESGFNVAVPEPHEARAMDLEYGTRSTPPSAVMRRFLQRIGRTEPGEVVIKTMGDLL